MMIAKMMTITMTSSLSSCELDIGLGVVGGVGRLDVQGDRLSWRGDDDSEDDDDNNDIITELL